MASNVMNKLVLLYGKDCGVIKGTDMYSVRLKDKHGYEAGTRIIDFDGEILLDSVFSIDSLQTDELGNISMLARDRDYAYIIPIVKGARKKPIIAAFRGNGTEVFRIANNYSNLLIQVRSSQYGEITNGRQRLMACTGVPLSREAEIILPVAYSYRFLAIESYGITHIINSINKSILKLAKPVGIRPTVSYMLSPDIIYVSNETDMVLLDTEGHMLNAMQQIRIGSHVEELDVYSLANKENLTVGFISKQGVITPIEKAIKSQEQHKYNPKLRHAILEIGNIQARVLLTQFNNIHQFVD